MLIAQTPSISCQVSQAFLCQDLHPRSQLHLLSHLFLPCNLTPFHLSFSLKHNPLPLPWVPQAPTTIPSPFIAFSVVTQSADAMLVVLPKPPSSLTQTALGKQLRMSRFASISMRGAVQSPTAPASMSVPTVVLPTQLNLAISNGFLSIVTPFLWDKWKNLLGEAGALEQFVDVPKGICFGWKIGVSLGYVQSYSFTPNNHHSSIEHLNFIHLYIHTEVQARHYSGLSSTLISFLSFASSLRSSFRAILP